MPLPSTEVNVEIKDLLVDKWSGDPISVSQTFDTAWISTGQFDEEQDHAQITLANVSEPTDPDALASGGGLASWVDGTVDCNVWVPYDREAYTSAGVAKSFRYDLGRKVHSIIEDNQTGTTDSNGDPVLTRLTTGNIRRNPVDPPPPYRMLIPVRFQYRTSP